MSLLVVEDLTVTYPGANRPAVKGASLEIESGRTLAVVGESGSGKTTLALALAGLLDRRAVRQAARLEINGEDLLAAGRRRWRQLRRTDISFIFPVPDQLVESHPDDDRPGPGRHGGGRTRRADA